MSLLPTWAVGQTGLDLFQGLARGCSVMDVVAQLVLSSVVWAPSW